MASVSLLTWKSIRIRLFTTFYIYLYSGSKFHILTRKCEYENIHKSADFPVGVIFNVSLKKKAFGIGNQYSTGKRFEIPHSTLKSRVIMALPHQQKYRVPPGGYVTGVRIRMCPIYPPGSTWPHHGHIICKYPIKLDPWVDCLWSVYRIIETIVAQLANIWVATC